MSARRVARRVCACMTVAACALDPSIAEQPPARGPAEEPPIPDQWIAPLPDEFDPGGPFGAVWREEQMSQWVVWPSDEYIAARQPPKNRSVPPASEIERKGAARTERPRWAAFDAFVWLENIIRQEYRPKHPESSVVLLQEDDPCQSSAICRFEVNGTKVQMFQRRWAVCVVVRPGPEVVKGVRPEAVGPTVFRAVFSRGEAMSAVPAHEVAGVPDGMHAFAGERSTPNWWGWLAWYTDGQAVAVYLRRYDGGQHKYGPDDPWF